MYLTHLILSHLISLLSETSIPHSPILHLSFGFILSHSFSIAVLLTLHSSTTNLFTTFTCASIQFCLLPTPQHFNSWPTVHHNLKSCPTTRLKRFLQLDYLSALSNTFLIFSRRCQWDRSYYRCGDWYTICTYSLRMPLLRLLRQLLPCRNESCTRTC